MMPKVKARIRSGTPLNLLTKLYWLDIVLCARMTAIGEDWWISRTQRFVIMNIACGFDRASDIARNLGVTRQSVSFVLKDLQDREIIETKQDPAHRRSNIITFTKEFERIAALSRGFADGFERDLAAHFGDKTFKNFLTVLISDWSDATKAVEPEKLTAKR